jgi:hypothetical protein
MDERSVRRIVAGCWGNQLENSNSNLGFLGREQPGTDGTARFHGTFESLAEVREEGSSRLEAMTFECLAHCG